ncbi:hypothetical protein K8W59_18200 [Nocardioides rotundus]|uniref:DUF3592 domain-containing protein n=1 Tax=Nocardioides rotundus TaxID=1774216 RepID=UPI001CBACB6E|nr:hypothetical protein [Nocardioides rotundus]UAL29648.1 hypothetical protein K8W59_18200 [Nocardioides rotundus]
MKGCLLVGAISVAMLGVVLGVMVWGMERGADSDAAFTRAAKSQVLDGRPEKNYKYSPSNGQQVRYRYTFGGQTYTDTGWVSQTAWEEFGLEVRVCVNPDDPASHVVILRPNARCGEGNVGADGHQRAQRVGTGRG